jgi:endonuclease-8
MHGVEILPTSREGSLLGHLGPDVLGPGWDPEKALVRLLEQPTAEIGVALIDQRVMAGPGNVYKSEVLFLRGVHPRRAVCDVRDPAALVSLVKRLMDANRTSSVRVTTGDRRPGRSLWVYGRGGKPCRRCGTAIEWLEQGGEARERITYLCPSCQR